MHRPVQRKYAAKVAHRPCGEQEKNLPCSSGKGLWRERNMAEIYLKEVSPDNWRVDIDVSEEQRHYVSNLSRTLARAYAYRNSRSKAYLIYADDTPVGVAMYYDIEELQAYDFSQFFIDRRYQGRGYGRTACKLVLDEMKRDGRYREVVLCYIEGNDAAERMYSSFGFRPTGEVDEDEIVMSLKW